MRQKFMTEIRVGIFVLIALLLGMMTLFQLGSGQDIFDSQYTLFTSFKDISGLRVGAQVQLAGLNVGFVDEIRFPDDLLVRNITVVLRIKKGFQRRIREDSVATVNTQGLLGDKFIYISVGSEDMPVIKDEGILPNKETTSIFALAEKAGEIMDNIGEASTSLNELLKGIGGKDENNLRESIKSLRVTLQQVEKGKGLVHALIYDPKGEEVIANLSATMKSVKEITTGVSDNTKEKTASLIKNLQDASADLKVILGSIRNGEGTLGLLVRDPALYNDIRALFGRANRNALIKAIVRSTIEKNETVK
ncbi:MAG: hypothetical protein COS89_05760 [Deltaproteobacteria bacterium CG07_land_8_20_14_0_80_38_7]|nr:MAG: hypothetical protein COS89_05760 [Deltaproteobacteria bacterium CG07_land_8_20_14_0_80_38_7]